MIREVTDLHRHYSDCYWEKDWLAIGYEDLKVCAEQMHA